MSKKRQRREPSAELLRAIEEELSAYREELERISTAVKSHLQQLVPNRGADRIESLIELYSYASSDDRKQILTVSAKRLGEIAEKGEKQATHAAIAESVGKAFPSIVLQGTVHQRLVCALAVQLGLLSEGVRASLRKTVIPPLIKALIVVLRVGAPTTRDSAVEGLGALLKSYSDAEKEEHFPVAEAMPASQENPAPTVSAQYFERLARRRLMALAVAGHAASRKEFLDKLREPIGAVIAKIRKRADRTAEDMLGALYTRADLLRTLPAMARQTSDTAFPKTALGFLRDGARLPAMREDDEMSVLIAYARYQESVFRTIDVLIKRDLRTDFDRVMADAVTAIQPTLVGPPIVVNAQVRATVAILRTAIRLIEEDQIDSATRNALAPLFRGLRDDPSPWMNLGIAEGCYLGLPFLVSNELHEDLLSRPALDALFRHLQRDHDPADFVETHRQLIANSCFRRMLILRMEHGGAGAIDSRQSPPSEQEREVRTLLLGPDTEHVLEVFQGREASQAGTKAPPRGVAEVLISGMAFESDLLKRSAEIFRRWEEYSPVQKVLLTRILAAELRASSQDAREIARYSTLERLYASLPTISLPEKERLGYVWDLLAALPPEAAGAADSDLQDFVDHCGRRDRDAGGRSGHVDDLPGHVLAMISDAPTGGIADAIAREIDLNLRHEREAEPEFDFAKLLYQVTLRGPDKSVFDHLLPRVRDDGDPAMVLLFRKHVEAMHQNFDRKSDEVRDMNLLLEHVDELGEELKTTDSETLLKLSKVLDLYGRLSARSQAVWDALVEGDSSGGLGKLFQLLDELAAEPPEEAGDESRPSPTRRMELVETYSESIALIETDVSHYLELSVGEFEARTTALHRARNTTRELGKQLRKHAGLQPPERIMLMALMERLYDFFHRTIRWFCEEPRRRKDADDHKMFWVLFACTPHEREELAKGSVALRFAATGEDSEKAQEQQLMEMEVKRLRLSAGDEPPAFSDQHKRFERYYVEWMESELRVDVLKTRLQKKWSTSFAAAYGLMTNLRKIVPVLLSPFLVAVVLHCGGVHEWEGIGFFLVACVVVPATLVSLSPAVRNLPQWIRWKKPAEGTAGTPVRGQRRYRLNALLPRLARMIIVPMALIVELDHSYEFSLYASTWVLLLLFMLAFLTTRFFISREVFSHEERHASNESPATLYARVRQVMAVSLSHSAGIAMLFAIIFASSHIGGMEPHDRKVDVAPSASTSAFFAAVDWFYSHVDANCPPHHFPVFAGIVPRDIMFDIGQLIDSSGREIPPGLVPHLQFTYYPTLILTWTALALFVGMFLEGFVKGERLRGDRQKEE